MAKMGCAKCGGTKKMALGGSAVKKAPVQLYGIPQENMGTSSQMGFGRKGGSVKKMQVGGTAVPKKPVVKTVTPPKRIIDSKIPMSGPSRPTPKPMMAKKGGMVKKPLAKAQDGKIVGEMYKRTTPFQDYLKNNKGAVASDTLGKSVVGKPEMGYFSSANPKNEKALGKAIDKTNNKKKMGGATKSKKK